MLQSIFVVKYILSAKSLYPSTHKKREFPKELPFVVLPGFEPRQAEPKTAVLPLHHKTILYLKTHRLKSVAKICTILEISKISRYYFAIIK